MMKNANIKTVRAHLRMGSFICQTVPKIKVRALNEIYSSVILDDIRIVIPNVAP